MIFKSSQQIFAHVTTAELSWHVQGFIVIWWPKTDLQQNIISVMFIVNIAREMVSRLG